MTTAGFYYRMIYIAMVTMNQNYVCFYHMNKGQEISSGSVKYIYVYFKYM